MMMKMMMMMTTDDDDNDDDDYIAFASLVEGGVGADIYVCLELKCLL